MSDINLHSTMDAAEWAREFIRINGGDFEILFPWFANSIMVGYDFANRRAEKRIEELEKGVLK